MHLRRGERGDPWRASAYCTSDDNGVSSTNLLGPILPTGDFRASTIGPYHMAVIKLGLRSMIRRVAAVPAIRGVGTAGKECTMSAYWVPVIVKQV